MIVLRLAGAQRLLLGALALLTLTTAFLATAVPPALTGEYDRTLRDMVSGTSLSVQLKVPAGQRQGTLPPTEAQLAARRRVLRGLLPAAYREVTGPIDYHLTTDDWLAGYDKPPITHARLSLWDDPAVATQVRYVEGRAPDNRPGRKGPLQIALAAPAAAKLSLRLGDRVTLSGKAVQDRPVTVMVSGLFQADSAAGPFWADRRALLDPPLVPEGRAGDTIDVFHGKALLDFAGYEEVYRAAGMDVTFTWWFPIKPDRFAAAAVPALRSGLEAFRAKAGDQAAGGTVDPGALPGEVATDLDVRLADFAGRLKAAKVILWLGLSGLTAVAAGVLLLAVRLLGDRLAPELATMRARGGSTAQLCVISTAVTALAALPALALGMTIAPGAPPSVPVVLALLVLVLGPPSLLVIRSTRSGRALHRGPRLALETLVVVLAVVAAVVLRRRDGGSAGPDPMITAVPVLLGLAAALLTLRGYPYPMRLFGRLLRRRRGAVAFVGMARASRQSVIAGLPMGLLLLATAVAAFAATVGTGLDRAQDRVAWQGAGADATLTEGNFGGAVYQRLRAVPGVEGLVPGRVIVGAKISGPHDQPAPITVIAVDMDDYRKAVAHLVSGLPREPRDPKGVFFSPTAARDTQGRDFELDLGRGGPVPVRRAGAIGAFPGCEPESPCVVMPYKLLPGAESYPTVVYVRGPGADPAALRAAAKGAGDTVTITTFRQQRKALSEGPLAGLVAGGFRYAEVAVAGYSVLIVLLALASSGEARGRTVSYLRTLGLSRRQSLGLAATEVAPVIVGAAAAGWAVGLLLPRITGPALDLSPYTRGLPATPHAVDPATVAVLAGGLLAITALAVVAESAITVRRTLGGVLRMGEH